MGVRPFAPGGGDPGKGEKDVNGTLAARERVSMGGSLSAHLGTVRLDVMPTAAAEAVHKAYVYSLELLKSTPDMGREYDTNNPRLAGIRFTTIHRYSNYLIFYRRAGDVIDVLHVWHGARDIASLLDKDADL
jgi:plasmid stabilization system protein ParE